MENKSGIYKILNLADGKFYIGSTKNFSKRWAQHQADLISGNHGNRYLQRAFNKYGKDLFEFQILSYQEEENLLKEEQILLDFYCKDPSCYNMSRFSSSPMKGRCHSEEAKLKMSMACKGKKASLETKLKMSRAWIGHIVSKETREKISRANKGNPGHTPSKLELENICKALQGEKCHTSKLNEAQVLEIIGSEEVGKILSEKYGVSIGTISKIKSRKLWKYLNEEKNPKSKSKAKLTETQVKEILISKESNKRLTEIYGVSSSTISQIRSRKLWKNIEI